MRAVVYTALLLIVVQALAVCYPSTILIIWPDSLGYLGPAIDLIERGQFTHWYGRGFVYPAFLLGVLSFSSDPAAIVYAQRALAVATCACLAAAFCLLARHAYERRVATIPVLAALTGFWLLVLMLYPASLVLVHAVMAEAFFSCLLAVALLCLVVAGVLERRTARLTAAFLGTVASCALVYVKPHWMLAAFVFPVAVGWASARPPRRRESWLTVGVALAAAGLLFAWPEHQLRERHDRYTSRVFGPRSLYCNNADLIQQFLADRPTEPLAALVRPALDRILSPDARAAAVSAGWRRLGFDGDHCMYGETVRIIADHFRPNTDAEVWYYLRSYALAAAHTPGHVVLRLGKQLGSLAVLPFGSTALTYVPDSLTVIESEARSRSFYRNWLERHERRFRGTLASPLEGLASEPSVSLFYSVCGAIIVLTTALAGVRLLVRGVPPACRALARCWMSTVFLVAATNILIAVVHTFDIGPAARYATMQSPAFVLLGFLSCLVVVLTKNPAPASVPGLGVSPEVPLEDLAFPREAMQ